MAKQETILSRLYHWEKTAPEKVHFVQPVGGGKVETLTWKQCLDQVRRMAAHLKSMNFPDKSQIALVGKNSAHWMMADWAIWMAGHVTVPIYPTLNSETVKYILEHSESKLIFLGRMDDWDEMKAGVPADMPGIRLPMAPEAEYKDWSFLCASHEPMEGEPERDPDEMATIVYTSGSTGQPKGVMHSFNAFNVLMDASKGTIPMTAEDRVLSYLPLAHVYERALVELPSSYFGFTVYFNDSLATFIEDLRRAKPTVFLSVPRLWTKFEAGVAAKMPKKKQELLFKIPILGKKVKKKILTQLGLEHVRYAATGSAPLPASTVKWYQDIGLDLLEGYGMSEDFAMSHITQPGQSKVGYVGKPQPGVEARIAENGEIQVKSPARMMGYFKEPEKTAESFTDDGFFKTGDMGEYDAEGSLKITGRIKELFKISKGKYVAPVPIESKLVAHDKVEVACVAGADQPATFALIHLAEEFRNKAEKDSLCAEMQELMEKTNATLDPHEQMQFMVLVGDTWSIADGFLTPTMKIKRNVIEKHYDSRLEAWYGSRQKIIWELG